jgi:hypothetical protein
MVLVFLLGRSERRDLDFVPRDYMFLKGLFEEAR